MHYGWWILAFVLIGAELLAPGYFLIWIGFAAAALGAVTFFTPELSLLVQAVLFAVLALISCFIYWRFVTGRCSTVAPSSSSASATRWRRRSSAAKARCASAIHRGSRKGRICRPAPKSKWSASTARR